jgi:nucleotide-binding universal stress UspA family protein
MMAKRILVPVGDVTRAEAIVPVVAALARESGGTVRLVSVQPLQRTSLLEYASKEPMYGYDVGVTIDLQQRVLAYGHAQEDRLESETLERLRRLEPLLEEITREADAFDADLVAVTERRRPWWRPALARIVDRVRARVGVPVLTLAGGAR